MSGRANQIDQIAAMSSIIEVAPHAAAVRNHLRSILDSPAFKGSRRSQEFLQFIVERALDRHFDDLKERMLGVELFGRSPSYDTGDDAIVRVTACDVRKRLNQFYSEIGHQGGFRIELPPGSYIPEIHSIPAVPGSVAGNGIHPVETITPPVAAEEKPALASSDVKMPAATTAGRRRLASVSAAAILAGIVLVSGGWLWKQRQRAETNASPLAVLPWSALIQPNRQLHLVFCDPEIVNIQRLLNSSITLSDYANQRYWSNDIKPELRRVFQVLSFRGASVAAVDAAIGLKVDKLVLPVSKHEPQMHTARSMRLGDFKSEDSFVLFGSPRSNPWVELFEDQLDFSFEFDSTRKAEFLKNKRPKSGEAADYVPTAEGWGTGQAYAIVALVSNPDQSGQVLLLAGSNAEATEAAGKLAVNLPALSKILRDAGIDPNGSSKRFEILLRVSTMAGSPNTFDVIACHALNNRS